MLVLSILLFKWKNSFRVFIKIWTVEKTVWEEVVLTPKIFSATKVGFVNNGEGEEMGKPER